MNLTTRYLLVTAGVLLVGVMLGSSVGLVAECERFEVTLEDGRVLQVRSGGTLDLDANARPARIRMHAMTLRTEAHVWSIIGRTKVTTGPWRVWRAALDADWQPFSKPGESVVSGGGMRVATSFKANGRRVTAELPVEVIGPWPGPSRRAINGILRLSLWPIPRWIPVERWLWHAGGAQFALYVNVRE
jgi:hypothetical protein